MTNKKKAEGNMSNQVSVSIGANFPGEVTEQQARDLGLGEWHLSETTIEEIKVIESNIRLAELQSGHILFG
ncbi:MAG: hypothetical protein WBQ17_08170 [Rhizomicrobium sp.]